MLIMILMLMLFVGILGTGIRLAWCLARFMFGLGLFWFCPLLFLLAVLFGGFSHMWVLILIVGILCGRGFVRQN